MRSPLTLLLLILAATFSLGTGSCSDDPTNPRTAIDAARRALEKNDLTAFRATLSDSAVTAWGNAQGFDALRSVLASAHGHELSEVRALGAAKDGFGQPLEGMSAHFARITGESENDAREDLVRATIECGKERCQVTTIELYECDRLGSPERTLESFAKALRADDLKAFRATLSGQALEELGSAERMSELREDSKSYDIKPGIQSPRDAAAGAGATSQLLALEILTPAHELDAIVDCRHPLAGACAATCTITAFEPAGTKAPKPAAAKVETFSAFEKN